MGTLPTYKDIWELIKKGSNLEAQEKIIELREACLLLQEESTGLKKQNEKLESALDFKKKLTFKAPFYFADGDETPYCPRCWEKDHEAIHVVRMKSCPECEIPIAPCDVHRSIELAIRMTPAMESDDPEFVDALRHLRETAVKHGVSPGMHTLTTEQIQRRSQEGWRFLALGSDASLMLGAAKEKLGELGIERRGEGTRY